MMGAAISGRDQSSRFASPDQDPKNKQVCLVDLTVESQSRKQVELSPELDQKPVDLLKDDFVVALHARDNLGFHVARQRVSEMAGSLDTIPNAAKRDPAAKVPCCFQQQGTPLEHPTNDPTSERKNKSSLSTLIYPGHTWITVFFCWLV